jgi:hypothetical protein
MRECQVSPDELFALYEDARSRVERSPRMRKYSDILLSDGWAYEDHLRWVIKAKVSEIVEWAETIRRDCE